MSFRRMRHVKAREFQGCDIAYDFSNPATLYDATSGGSLVAADGGIARANDVSGGSGHMTQGTSTFRPLRKVAAVNGLDIARFDGSNDYLTAGDVADLGANPVTMMAIASVTANAGLFVKSRYDDSQGRFGFFRDGTTTVFFIQTNTLPSFVTAANSTAVRCHVGTSSRVAGPLAATVRLEINGAASTATYTDSGTTYDTSNEFLIGSYNTSTGSPGQYGYFLNGDVGECAKWSVLMNAAVKKRLDQSRCRKWRLKTS